MSPKDAITHDAVFGPVPSRRLGMSLGVDLLLPKICSQDCLYCELGRTTDLTAERGAFRNANEVLAQVEARLSELDYDPDYITLAGSGEPTLHRDMGKVISGLKKLSGARVSVLTNSTLMQLPEVRAGLMAADVVVPSLDAAGQEVFEKINRPAAGLKIADMINGLIAFRKEYNGLIWLEVLLVGGINDSPEELRAIVEAAGRIRPDKVQLNTVVRPPAYQGTKALSYLRLQEIAEMFSVPAEVIAPPSKMAAGDKGKLQDEVRHMTLRRPCTEEDLARMTGLEPEAVAKMIAEMAAKGWLVEEPFDDTCYYRGTEG